MPYHISSSRTVSATIEPDFLHTLGQYLLNLILVLGEIVNKVVPHLRVMLVLLLAVPRPVRDREHAAALEHERNCALGNLHLGRRCSAGSFEL